MDMFLVDQENIKERLERHIKKREKPKFMDVLGIYPAYASVEASKVQLKVMNMSGI